MTKKSKARRDGMDLKKKVHLKERQSTVGQGECADVEQDPSKVNSIILTANVLALFKESQLKKLKHTRKESIRAYRQDRIARFDADFEKSFETLAKFLSYLPDEQFVELIEVGIHDVCRAENISQKIEAIVGKAEKGHLDASKSFKIKAIALDELSKLPSLPVSKKSELLPNHTALTQAKKTLEQHQSTMFTLSSACAKVMVSNERVQDRYADVLGQRQRYEELIQVLRNRRASEKAIGKVLTLKSIRFLEAIQKLHKMREEKTLARSFDLTMNDRNNTVRCLSVYDQQNRHFANLKEILLLKETSLENMKVQSARNAADLADISSEVISKRKEDENKVVDSLKYKAASKTSRYLESKIREISKSLDCLRKELDVNYDRLQKLKIENEFFQLSKESDAEKDIPVVELKSTWERLQVATRAIKQEASHLECKVKSADTQSLQEQILQEEYMHNQDITRKQLKFLEERLSAEGRQHEELKLKMAEIQRFVAFKENLFLRQCRGPEETPIQKLFPAPAHLGMQPRFFF